MSTAELAAYLKERGSFAEGKFKTNECPRCGSWKKPDFEHCWKCYTQAEKLSAQITDTAAQLRKERLAAGPKLPAKNQIKGRIVNKLMNQYELRTQVFSPEPSPKPKTILRRKT